MIDFKSYTNNHIDKYVLKDNEYVKGDKIYCKKCKGLLRIKKFSRVQRAWVWSTGDENNNNLECECMVDMEKRRNESLNAELHRQVYNNPKLLSLIGSGYTEKTFNDLLNNTEPSYIQARKALEKYSENIDNIRNGKGWYIFSTQAGNGKSTLMACVRNALVSKGVRCVMINVQNLIDIAMTKNDVKDTSEVFSYNTFRNAECLLIDDIGAMDLSHQNIRTLWANQELYELINYRDINNLSTCFTSNYSIESLKNDRGIDFKTVDRISSRSISYYKQIEGSSFRNGSRK